MTKPTPFSTRPFSWPARTLHGEISKPQWRGEVEVLRIEHRGLADQALQHGGLQVVDHEARRHAAEGGKCVLVAGQEELHLLRDGELQVHAPAVAQHHHEEAQAPARGAHGDGAPFAPVDLGTLARGEVELEEGLLVARADAVHVVLDDADAAVVARLAQALEDLLRAVRMGIEPAHDLALEGIELAGTRQRRRALGTAPCRPTWRPCAGAVRAHARSAPR